MNEISIGCIAMMGTPWDLEDNFFRMSVYVREAAKRRANLVIAPECVLDGYVFVRDPESTKEKLLNIAQTIPDGPYLTRAGELCRDLGVHLVFGFLEKEGDELYNACAMLDPEGKVVAHYRKIHPHHEAFIRPGGELKPFDTKIARIGFLICSDRHRIDNFSTLGVQGVEIIIIPADGGGTVERLERLKTFAELTHCWIIMANTRSSAIFSPSGQTYLERHETECVTIQRIDLTIIPKGRSRSQFISRRPDLYAPLMSNLEEFKLFDEYGQPTDYELEARKRKREEIKKNR